MSIILEIKKQRLDLGISWKVKGRLSYFDGPVFLFFNGRIFFFHSIVCKNLMGNVITFVL